MANHASHAVDEAGDAVGSAMVSTAFNEACRADSGGPEMGVKGL